MVIFLLNNSNIKRFCVKKSSDIRSALGWMYGNKTYLTSFSILLRSPLNIHKWFIQVCSSCCVIICKALNFRLHLVPTTLNTHSLILNVCFQNICYHQQKNHKVFHRALSSWLQFLVTYKTVLEKDVYMKTKYHQCKTMEVYYKHE